MRKAYPETGNRGSGLLQAIVWQTYVTTYRHLLAYCALFCLNIAWPEQPCPHTDGKGASIPGA